MKFKELLKLYSDEDIAERVEILYPDQRKEGYLKVAKELRKTRPLRTSVAIEISHHKDDDGEEWEDVSGIGKPDKYGSTHYGIALTGWGQWLSMPITPETLKKYPEIDILAYCLWEMTFYGFSDKQIQRFGKKLVKDAKQARKDIKEHPERFKKLESLEEDEV